MVYLVSKSKQKDIASLKQQKFRQEKGLFVVEGVKMVEELLDSSYTIETICALKDWVTEHAHDTRLESIEVYEASISDLMRMSSFVTPNKVLAVVRQPEPEVALESPPQGLILGLDNVRDPGNLGTILRTAEWYGINHVFCSSETVECYNPKVIQASMGSFFRLNVVYTSLPELIASWKQSASLLVYGLTLGGENIYTSNLPTSGMMIVGNESQGISHEVDELLSHRVFIPSFGKSMAESLNVAVATAIACSEFRRGIVADQG